MAFAALSHLSLITLGIYGLTLTGWEGAVYQVLNHGVVDGALFLLLGLIYDRYQSSQINAYGGLAAKLPRTAAFFVIAMLAMIGLPMLSGFVGEFLILLSTFTGVSKGWAIASTLGVILGAAYMLWLVQSLFYGATSALSSSKPPEDLRVGQLAVLAPLAVLMLVMGVAPMLWLPMIESGAHPPPITRSAYLQPPPESMYVLSQDEKQPQVLRLRLSPNHPSEQRSLAGDPGPRQTPLRMTDIGGSILLVQMKTGEGRR
jgi:NADH-quinone oxidoreductase subunit M